MPEPFNFGKELLKVPGLDGTGKMGKTAGNGIYLVDEPDMIRKKVMRAVTDAGPTKENQEMTEPIKNLFTLMEIVSTKDTVEHFREEYNTCSIRYGDMKKQLAEDIIRVCTPLRERINEILADENYIRKAAEMGREKARASASKTLKDVKEIIGFRPF
jgi:tryptophanyl-tRNA synthetase